MQRSPITSLKLSLASKARGAAFDLLTSSIPLGMQHRLRIACLWTSTHFQKQLRYKCSVDTDTSGYQVWSLYRSLHPPQKEVMKHHNHLFLPDISGYKLLSFLVLEISPLLVRLNPYLLPQQYPSLLFNLWTFNDGALLFSLHLAFFLQQIHLVCITEDLHVYGHHSAVLQHPKPPYSIFKC